MKLFTSLSVTACLLGTLCGGSIAWADPMVSTPSSSAQGVLIPPTANASCTWVTGTWRGMVWDQGGLFGDGGPWQIQADLYAHDQSQKVIGKLKAQGLVASALSKPIWAQCHNGVLQSIFVGEKGHCGAVSEGGILATKNLLIIPIHYENSMADTHLILLLERVDSHYQGDIPHEDSGFELGKVESCH